MIEIRKQMYANIQGYNRHLTIEHLDKLNWRELLSNCHPIERIEFERKLRALKQIP